jgi:hypothetical protein
MYMNNTHTLTTTPEQVLLHKTRKGAKFDNHTIMAAALNGATLHQVAKAIDLPPTGSLKRRLSWLVTKEQAMVLVDGIYLTPDQTKNFNGMRG